MMNGIKGRLFLDDNPMPIDPCYNQQPIRVRKTIVATLNIHPSMLMRIKLTSLKGDDSERRGSECLANLLGTPSFEVQSSDRECYITCKR